MELAIVSLEITPLVLYSHVIQVGEDPIEFLEYDPRRRRNYQKQLKEQEAKEFRNRFLFIYYHCYFSFNSSARFYRRLPWKVFLHYAEPPVELDRVPARETLSRVISMHPYNPKHV